MKSRLTWIAALTLALGLIAAGCGGDDDDGNGDATDAEPAVEAPSKAEYIAQADQICRESNQEIEQAIEDAPATEAPPEEFITETMVPLFEQEFEQLRALTPPAGDEETVDRIYSAAEEGVAQIKEDASNFQQTGEAAGLQEASGLAEDYGFKVCGQGG